MEWWTGSFRKGPLVIRNRIEGSTSRDGQSVRLPFWESRVFGPHRSESNEWLKNVCLPLPSQALLGQGKRTGWFNVRIMRLGGISGNGARFKVRQHYKVTMSVNCHKSVLILIWPQILPGRKTPRNNQLKARLACHYRGAFWNWLLRVAETSK